jgi:hypothetical protein
VGEKERLLPRKKQTKKDTIKNVDDLKTHLGYIYQLDENLSLKGGGVNTDSSALTSVAVTQSGVSYAAGIDYYTTDSLKKSQPFGSVWLWSKPNQNFSSTFTRINMPANVAQDIKQIHHWGDTLYIAGLGTDNVGHVWKYDAGKFSDTGLKAVSVNDLKINPFGVLYACGSNSNGEGEVWIYDPQKLVWESLGLKNSDDVRQMAFNTSDFTLYAIGKDKWNNATVWSYVTKEVTK